MKTIEETFELVIHLYQFEWHMNSPFVVIATPFVVSRVDAQARWRLTFMFVIAVVILVSVNCVSVAMIRIEPQVTKKLNQRGS